MRLPRQERLLLQQTAVASACFKPPPYEFPGQPHPEVGAAVAKAFEMCSAAGVAAGSISGDGGVCRGMVDAGASFVAVGTDLSILGAGLRRALHEVARDA